MTEESVTMTKVTREPHNDIPSCHCEPRPVGRGNLGKETVVDIRELR
jgi:hypothetical protein